MNAAQIRIVLQAIDKVSPVMASVAAGVQQGVGKIDGAYAQAKRSAEAFRTKHAESFKAVGQAAALVTGAIVATAGAVVALGMRGGEIASVRAGFEKLSRAIGESGDTMLSVARTATKGLISDFDLMAAGNKAMLLGLPLTAQEFGDLAMTAVTLGKAMKQGPTKSLDDLVNALGRSEREVLDNLGIIVSADEANRKYADAIGKTVQQLTDADRKQAFYNEAMDKAREKVAALGGITLTFNDRVQQGRTLMSNFTDSLSVGIATSPVLATAFDGIASSLQGAFGPNQAQTIATIIGWVNRAAIVLVDVGLAGISTAKWITLAFSGLKIVFATLGTLVTGLAAGILGAFSSILNAAEKIPGIGGQFNEAAAAMRNMKAQADGMRDSFSTQLEEAYVGALNQAQGFDAARGSLEKLKGKMVEASKQAVTSTDITNALAAAADGAADRTGGLGDAVDRTTGKTKKLDAAVAGLQQQFSKLIATNPLAILDSLPGSLEVLQDTFAAPKARVLDFRTSARAPQLPYARNPLDVLGTIHQFPGVTLGAPPKQSIFAGFGQVFQQLPQTIMAALQGGGNVMKSVGGSIGSFFGSTSSTIGKALSGGLTKALGGTLGGALGSIVPGLGTLLGSFAGSGIGKLFGGLFGGGEKKEAQGMASQFVEQMGGLEQLTKLAKDAGVSLDALMSAKKKNVAEAEIKKITDALQKQQEETERLNQAIAKYGLAWGDLGETARGAHLEDVAQGLIADHDLLIERGYNAKAVIFGMGDALNEFFGNAMTTGSTIPAAMAPMLRSLIEAGKLTEENARLLLGLPASGVPAFAEVKEAADRYGISIDALGPKVRQLEINETAQQVVDDFQLLVAAGGDVGAIMAGMSDKVQGFVDSALKFGLELPASMRPMLEQMAKAGQLVDANGDKLTDLSGIKFAEPLSEAVDRLLAKLDELIDSLTGGVEEAMARVTRDRRFTWKGEVDVDGDGLPSYQTGGGKPGFAFGTQGRYMDFGPGTDVTLHGRERVVTAAEGQREAAAAAMSTAAMESRLGAIERLLRDQPGQMYRAMRDANLQRSA